MSDGHAKGSYSLRIGAPQRVRAEKLIHWLQSRTDIAGLCGGEVSVSDVVRVALERGLRALEREAQGSELADELISSAADAS